jgi:di/tricarboxylate transporter
MPAAVVGFIALAAVVALAAAGRAKLALLAPALAVALAAWAGQDAGAIAGAFPWLLLLRLAAVTALFSMALVNGTLERVAWLALKAIGFRAGLAGPLVFVSAMGLASSGSGNFASASLLTPVAMTVAGRLRLNPFLMSVMVVYGATAGAFSPVAPTGMVAHTLLLRAGVAHSPWGLYAASLAAHALVAVSLYFALRGWAEGSSGAALPSLSAQLPEWAPVHRRTAAVIALFVAAGLAFRIPLEWGAPAAAALLLLLGATPGVEWAKKMPWQLIGLVTGVSMLAAVVHQMGGMTLLGRMLASALPPEWLPFELALVAGLISVTASSIGVVLPAFLPASGEIASLAGGDAQAIAYSINVGAHLVDISPLSPLGALCVAYAPTETGRGRLFRNLMLMGLVMCPVGAAICQLLFSPPLIHWLGIA